METTKETSEFTFTPTGEPDQLWVLSRASGETHRVDLKDFVCSCADFKFRHAKGDRMCKHLKAASEVYEIEPPKAERLPAVAEGQAITISQDEVIQELSTELRDEMIKNYVYAVPDYEREYIDKQGRQKKTKKAGWVDLKATGVRDLAHMVADRYGAIEVGEFRFMDVGDRWIAWRDIKLGNFTSTGFADCSKDREFPFRYLGDVVMRNAYKAIVPKIYQDIFTNKFRELMRTQLKELMGPGGEARLAKPVDQLSDGELAKELKEAQESKLRLKAAIKPQAETTDEKAGAAPAEGKSKRENWDGFRTRAKQLGLSEERACAMLGVNSLEEWTGQGKSVEEAAKVISERLAKPKTAVATPAAEEADTSTVMPAAEEEGFAIDLQWLKESQLALKWTNETMLSFITSQYKVSGKTVTEALNKLTREQAEDFTRRINDKLEKQSSLF